MVAVVDKLICSNENWKYSCVFQFTVVKMKAEIIFRMNN